MRKQRNHSFPKTYTTAGAVYRAKKNFQERFPNTEFVILKEDGKYVLESVGMTQEVVMETETREII